MAEGIDSVLVIPRTKKYANFYLNGASEPHTVSYDDLFNYLVNLDKNSSTDIAKCISESRIFMLFPKEHLVEIMTSERVPIREIQYRDVHNQLRQVPKKSTRGSFIQRSQEWVDNLSRK